MLVPYSWLKEFVNIDASAEEIAEALTMAGLEVEGIEEVYDYLEKIIVGEILEVFPHPKAESLSVCLVHGGEKTYRVVCGAPNVARGLKAPLALPGAILFNGEEVVPTTIRGEPSEAILCSAAEIGLEEERDRLMSLSEDLAPGLSLKEALGLSDPVFEIGITPNRGDCLSILGVAREIAAIFDSPLTLPPLPEPPLGSEINNLVEITIEEPGLCYRYAARILKGVKIGPSPLWLQRRLKAVGIRPINNIVDVTNYVLFEIGQPLHAFDLRYLEGSKVVVRRARPTEVIVTLDGIERRLDEETLVIADARRPVAIAGIMGGAESEITEETRDVLIESACFNPTSIRRTSQKLKLSSESSYRFERGTDPEGVILGLERAAALMGELAKGEIVSGRIDVYPRPVEKKAIPLKAKEIRRLLGEDIDLELADGILRRLQMEVRREGEILWVKPPSFRNDLSFEADLVEEVARLYGYGLIPTTLPKASLEVEAPERSWRLLQKLRQILTGLGLSEIISYSFIAMRWPDLLRLPPDDPRRQVVRILNPLSEDQAIMRPSLIPGLLETAQRNIFRGNSNLKLFEIGKVFIDVGQDLPQERLMIAGLITGISRPESCHEQPRMLDFFDLKGLVEALTKALRIEVEFRPHSSEPYLRTGISLEMICKERGWGHLGEISPALREDLDLKDPLYVFEISFEDLLDLWDEGRHFRPLPRYPATSRDIAIVISETIPAADILRFVQGQEIPYLEEVFIFDVYQGKNIPQGYRSLGLRFIYRAPDRTLTDEEVNSIQEELTQKILKEFKARIR
ncbi:phenylalanine--tRNA ligase subunit beta [Thermosulfuriphilus sp.]